MNIRIEEIPNISKNADVTLFAAEGYKCFVDDKIDSTDFTVVIWIKALVAYNRSGKIVGILAYDWTNDSKGIWIYSSYTSKRYRRKGIYTQLYEKLKEVCIDKDKSYIESGVHGKNKIMQKACKQQGRKPTTWIYYKWENKKAGKK